MQVVRHESLGRPESVLRLVDQPSDPLQPGEVRVRVLAAPIHPSDLLQITGQYVTRPALPAIPGSEGIGEVIEVAADVTHPPVGQRVMLLGVGGTWRDELVTPARTLVPLPAEGDVEQLAMIAVNPLTAHLLLTQFVALTHGDWIVQSAANSAVGTLLIQMAAQRGLRTINIVRKPHLVAELEAKGADVVLVDGDDLTKRIRAAAGSSPIRLAIDPVGGATFSALLDALAPGGTAVTYGMLSGQPPTLNLGAVLGNDLTVRGFWLMHWFRHTARAEQQQAITETIGRIARGEIAVEIDSRFPLTRIHEAVARAATPGRSGKVLLVPSSS